MKKLKNENGAITVIVLISILFMVSFLVSAYVIAANKVQTQKEIIAETRRIYETEKTMEEIYNSMVVEGPVLPEGYKKLEYIEANGNQYINTRFYPNTNTKAKYKVSMSQFDNWGPHLLSSSKYYFPMFINNKSQLLCNINNSSTNIENYEYGTNIVYEFESYVNNKVIINGEEALTLNTYTETETRDTIPLYIGACGGNLTANYLRLNGKIYYYKIYDGTSLERDLIPAYSETQEKAGLFDTIYGVFYTSNGPEEYIAGPEVDYNYTEQVIPIYTKEQYLKIGSNEIVKIEQLNNRYYQFSSIGTYVLMNGFEIDESELPENWVAPEFLFLKNKEGFVDYSGYEVTVSYENGDESIYDGNAVLKLDIAKGALEISSTGYSVLYKDPETGTTTTTTYEYEGPYLITGTTSTNYVEIKSTGEFDITLKDLIIDASSLYNYCAFNANYNCYAKRSECKN